MTKISPLVDDLVNSIQCLPGVGPKSAQRMALHLLERNREEGKILATSLERALENVGQCDRCRIFSELELCSLCSNKKRDLSKLCVVESVSDVFAIEQSQNYLGLYFVLHGHLSPIDNIGPKELGIENLEKLASEGEVKEIILATNSTLEGETTSQYIVESLKKINNLIISRLAQGVPIGGELEYVDRVTITQAFSGRINIKDTD